MAGQGEQPTRAREDFVVVAPDGIAVHPIVLPGLGELTVAEGRLPPGEYGVHLHRSLEQVTYVLEGRLVVTMGDALTGALAEVACEAGDAVCTPPLTTLSYRNPGPGLARVLFICAPPYPADNADTATLDRHRPLTPDELGAALERQRAVRAEMDVRRAAGIARLETLLAQAKPADRRG